MRYSIPLDTADAVPSKVYGHPRKCLCEECKQCRREHGRDLYRRKQREAGEDAGFVIGHDGDGKRVLLTSSRNAIPGEVESTCWCDHKVISVPATEIRAGRTASCGRPRCSNPEELSDSSHRHSGYAG